MYRNSGLNEYSWFWISGAVAIAFIAMSISFSSIYGTDDEIEFAKAGLEECPKRKEDRGFTFWVKDCVAYHRYMEEGKISEPKSVDTNAPW